VLTLLNIKFFCADFTKYLKFACGMRIMGTTNPLLTCIPSTQYALTASKVDFPAVLPSKMQHAEGRGYNSKAANRSLLIYSN